MTTEEFKVILVGESGVGKTSFVIRFAEGRFQNVYESTVGVDCKKVKMDIDGTPVELQIWDTAGQERFKSIINRFFRASHGAIIMYDVTKKITFDEVPWWLKEVNSTLSGIPIFLVGNKTDDLSQYEVLEELAQDFAEENRLYFYQTSALDNKNVTEVFQKMASMMLEDRRKVEEPDESSRLFERSNDSAYDVRTFFLKPNPPQQKKSCCNRFESSDTKAHVV
ncbi:ras-related protein Rab-13-like [Uloborus diversus]|uniref:ras-related protein Rab-13-like n=1 Tax=Uloborus diversus TaxID=327109 RepID=UPI0024090908|nr:ras-related protein Rab-13-like [Uloborus diversus]